MAKSVLHNSVLLAFCLLCLFSLTQCSNGEKTGEITPDMVIIKNDPDSKVAQSEIVFDNPVFDFGTITQGEIREHVFSFKNVGSEPLIISQVKPSCGCTVTKDWPKEPIAPGARNEIKIEFNSNKSAGPISKTVTIDTNGKPQTLFLTLEGKVLAPTTK